MIIDVGGIDLKKALYSVLVAVLAIAFAVSAFFVGKYVIESKKSADRYNELAQMVDSARADTTTATVSTRDRKSVV